MQLHLRLDTYLSCPRCTPRSTGQDLCPGRGLRQSPVGAAVLSLEASGSVLQHGRKRAKRGAVAAWAAAREAAVAGKYRWPISGMDQQTREAKKAGWSLPLWKPTEPESKRTGRTGGGGIYAACGAC